MGRTFDEQLDHAAQEVTTGSGGPLAKRIFFGGKTDADFATGASAYERAEGYNPSTGVDNFTGTTLGGMAEVRRNVKGPIKLPPMVRGGTGDADYRNHRGGIVPMPAGMPHALKSMSSLAPLTSAPSDNSKNVQIHQTNHNTVMGVSDPTAAAAQIGARQDRHASTLLRNMQSAVV